MNTVIVENSQPSHIRCFQCPSLSTIQQHGNHYRIINSLLVWTDRVQLANIGTHRQPKVHANAHTSGNRPWLFFLTTHIRMRTYTHICFKYCKLYLTVATQTFALTNSFILPMALRRVSMHSCMYSHYITLHAFLFEE